MSNHDDHDHDHEAPGAGTKPDSSHGHDHPPETGGRQHSSHGHEDHPKPGSKRHSSHGDHAGHVHGPSDFGRAFAIGITLQLGFVVAEIIVGLIANSLAVIADAGHNVSDVLALGLAWGATVLGKRKATKGRSFGFKSASILVAVANALTLVFVNGAVAWEAIGRFQNPEAVAPIPIIVVSAAGVAVNAFCAWLFIKGSKGDVNIRAAFLHLASDAVVAAGVSITGVLLYFTGRLWLDPAVSIAVAVVVLVSTWSLLRQALDLAMHAVPRGIDVDELETWLRTQSGVAAVHDLHVWALSTTENAMTVHLVMGSLPTNALACELDVAIRDKFAIHHVTVQFDPVGAPCALAADDVI